MDVSRLWQKTFPVRRCVLAVFLFWHLAAITLNNLPWSPLVEALFDTYRPYLGLTGTVQDGWSMYGSVHQVDNHYRLTGTDNAGRPFILPFPGQTRAGMIANRFQDMVEERDGSFLEAIGYVVPEDIQRAFGLYLCRRNPRAESVRLEMVSAVIPPVAEWSRPPEKTDYEPATTFTTTCPPAA